MKLLDQFCIHILESEEDLHLEYSVVSWVVNNIMTPLMLVTGQLSSCIHVPQTEAIHDLVASRVVPEGFPNELMFLDIEELDVRQRELIKVEAVKSVHLQVNVPGEEYHVPWYLVSSFVLGEIACFKDVFETSS